MSVTYYVAIPFVRTEDGELVHGEAVEVQGGPAAISKAGQLSVKNAGAIAFARTGDPAIGEFQPAVILARYGETPDECGVRQTVAAGARRQAPRNLATR